MRWIARALTAWRRSMNTSVPRVGSLRTTSRRVWVIASGVRSSWEALAVNLCCSASCASSRASIVSKASASSRNSSRRPSSWIRWESDPFAAMRVASVMRASGASIRPARIHPPTRPNTSRNANAAAAFGAKARTRSDRSGPGRTKRPGVTDRSVGYVTQQEHPHGREQQGTCKHEEPGVAEGELEANAQPRRPIHARLPQLRRLVPCRCGSRRRAPWRSARVRRAVCAVPRR